MSRSLKRFLTLAVASACAFCWNVAQYASESDAPVCKSQAPDIPDFEEAVAASFGRGTSEQPFVVSIPKGVYRLDFETALVEDAFVSNTDLTNPKRIGLTLRGLKNAVVDFNGSTLLTRGPVMTAVIEDCENVVVQNFSVDSESPAMVQVEVVRNDENGIALRPSGWYKTEVENGRVVFVGDGWRSTPAFGLAFDPKTKRTLFDVADIGTNFDGSSISADGLVLCPNWRDGRLVVGSVLVLRVDTFNLAGVFVNRCKNLTMRDVKIHYAPAKAVVAQRSENLYFDGVSICLKDGIEGERCFTANADAIHCSCCKGEIVVKNGVFESMMDDAINVHGAYVKTMKQIDARTGECRFMHSQTSGFRWAVPGDEVEFLNARKMESFFDADGRPVEERAVVESIRPIEAESLDGASRFELTFEKPIPSGVVVDENCALENVTQTASVVYRDNLIRNNRARGGLFATRKPVLIEGNTFDYVSGTAILCCGDANGWYESGPCRDVVIRNNRFVNCMTAFYQFCEAPISIYPEIPDFAAQKLPYNGGKEGAYTIENNVFDTFDSPILYARSTDGITFRNNVVKRNDDLPRRIAGDKKPFVFDLTNRVRVYDNQDDAGFEPARDVDARRTPEGGIRYSVDEPFEL